MKNSKKTRAVFTAWVHESTFDKKIRKKSEFAYAWNKKPNKHYKEVIIIEA